MSGNAKFRWFLVAPLLVALFVIVASPVSWAGELEDAQAEVRLNPEDFGAHNNLGNAYKNLGNYQKALD